MTYVLINIICINFGRCFPHILSRRKYYFSLRKVYLLLCIKDRVDQNAKPTSLLKESHPVNRVHSEWKGVGSNTVEFFLFIVISSPFGILSIWLTVTLEVSLPDPCTQCELSLYSQVYLKNYMCIHTSVSPSWVNLYFKIKPCIIFFSWDSGRLFFSKVLLQLSVTSRHIQAAYYWRSASMLYRSLTGMSSPADMLQGGTTALPDTHSKPSKHGGRLVHLKNHHVFLQIPGWLRKWKDAFDIEVSKTSRILLSDLPGYRRNNSSMNQKHFFPKNLVSTLFRKFNFLWDLVFKQLYILQISLNCQFF